MKKYLEILQKNSEILLFSRLRLNKPCFHWGQSLSVFSKCYLRSFICVPCCKKMQLSLMIAIGHHWDETYSKGSFPNFMAKMLDKVPSRLKQERLSVLFLRTMLKRRSSSGLLCGITSTASAILVRCWNLFTEVPGCFMFPMYHLQWLKDRTLYIQVFTL